MRGPEGHEEEAAPASLVNEEEAKVEEKTEEKVEAKTEEKVEEKKEEKVEEQKAPEPLTAESLTVPEGFELKPEMANQFLEILNGEMEPKDRANALIALHTKTVSEASEASSQAWETMQTEWKDAAKADPDVGGAKLQPTLTNIGKLLDEFGSKDLRGVFDLTGAGNNVHMIKFLNKIAGTLTEGGYHRPNTPGGDDPDAAASRLFPTAAKQG